MIPRVRSRWPIALIAVGVALLILNLTDVDFLDVAGVLSLWPIAAIAVGVDLLTRGRRRSLVIGVAVVAAAAMYFAGWWWPGGETVIAQPLADARSARVTLEPGVGDLTLDAAASAGTLLSGTLRTARGERVTQNLTRSDATANFTLGVRSDRPVSTTRAHPSELSLTNAVPVDLRVRAGVGDVTLDLAAARVSAIDFDAGVGSVDVTLARAGGYAAAIQLGVGSATLRVPAGVEARIAWQSGIGALRFDDAFTRVGDVLTTAGYATAAASERVDVTLNGGVGGVRVERGR